MVEFIAIGLENTENPIFSSIGKAISAWAGLEDAAFHAYWATLNLKPEIAAVSYFNLAGFQQRFVLTNKTIDLIIKDQALIAFWKKLYRITDAVRIERNFVAHNKVEYIYDKFKAPPDENTKIAQINSTFEAKYREKSSKTMSIDAINELKSDIFEVSAALVQFAMHASPQTVMVKEIGEEVDLSRLAGKYNIRL